MPICLESCPIEGNFTIGNQNNPEVIQTQVTQSFDIAPYVDFDKNTQKVCMNCHPECASSCNGITDKDCQGKASK